MCSRHLTHWSVSLVVLSPILGVFVVVVVVVVVVAVTINKSNA